MTWYHFTLSSLFPPIFLALQSIFQAIYSNFPLLSHSFPIVLRHIPSFFHCLSHILCYQFILPFHQFSQCFAMVLLDFSSVSNAYPNAPSTIPTVAPYKRFYSIVVTHRNCNFPLLFHCFTHALRDNGPTSESQFYLASFYPLPILSTVSPRVLINFPSVLLKFSIAFPFLFHCFMSKSLLFSIVFLIIFPSFPIFVPIVLCHIPSFFLLFFSSFSPPLQSPQVHLGGRTRGESIPQRHPIATWYITLKKFTCGHLFYHLISSFLSLSARSAHRPP